MKPDYAEAYFNLGRAHFKKGESDSAIKDYNTAITLKPDYAEAYLNLGVAYDSRDEFDAALENYNISVSLASDLPIAYSHRGAASLRKGEVKSAIEDYNTVLSLDPDYIAVYYKRGIAWLYVGEWEKAKADLIAAKDRGMAIMQTFHDDYRNVVTFEQKTGVFLPEDIGGLLIPQKGLAELEKETRLALALKYYKNGAISTGLAAQLVGISREAFWYLMGDYGLSLFELTEDLLAELDNASKTNYQ